MTTIGYIIHGKRYYIATRNDFVLYSGDNERKAQDSLDIAREQDKAMKDEGSKRYELLLFSLEDNSLSISKWPDNYRWKSIDLSTQQTQGLAKFLTQGRKK